MLYNNADFAIIKSLNEKVSIKDSKTINEVYKPYLIKSIVEKVRSYFDEGFLYEPLVQKLLSMKDEMQTKESAINSNIVFDFLDMPTEDEFAELYFMYLAYFQAHDEQHKDRELLEDILYNFHFGLVKNGFPEIEWLDVLSSCHKILVEEQQQKVVKGDSYLQFTEKMQYYFAICYLSDILQNETLQKGCVLGYDVGSVDATRRLSNILALQLAGYENKDIRNDFETQLSRTKFLKNILDNEENYQDILVTANTYHEYITRLLELEKTLKNFDKSAIVFNDKYRQILQERGSLNWALASIMTQLDKQKEAVLFMERMLPMSMYDNLMVAELFDWEEVELYPFYTEYIEKDNSYIISSIIRKEYMGEMDAIDSDEEEDSIQ